MKSLKLFPVLLFLAIPFARAISQELRAGLVRSLSPGVVSIEGRWRDPRTGKLGQVKIAGSGFFVDEQGRVLTCYHVIEGLKEITVRTQSGRRFNVRVIKTQPDADLALLGLTPLSGQPLVRLPITSAIPEIGARLIAIGSATPSRRVLNFLLPYYREIAAKTLSDPAAHHNLGRIYDALGHNAEAESAYRKSLRLEESADAWKGLGILFLTRPVGPGKTAQKRENLGKAIEYLTRAVEIAPDDGKARYNLAVAYFKIREKERARSQCDALLKLREKGKLTQPLLGNASRHCSWSNRQVPIKLEGDVTLEPGRQVPNKREDDEKSKPRKRKRLWWKK